MKTKTNFNTILKTKGLKVTKHRSSILEVMENNNYPITADEIYSQLKEENVSINLSSVYKILDTLVSSSIIIKCSLGDTTKTQYEINDFQHKHHLICNSCKKVFPINNCPLSSYEKQLQASMDFQVTNHKLEIYGYCKDCRK